MVKEFPDWMPSDLISALSKARIGNNNLETKVIRSPALYLTFGTKDAINWVDFGRTLAWEVNELIRLGCEVVSTSIPRVIEMRDLVGCGGRLYIQRDIIEVDIKFYYPVVY